MNVMLHTGRTAAPPWLSPADIAVIRAQFERLAGDADGFAIDFYDALFAISPLVRAMFRGPMPEQRGKLMQMLSLLVAKLEDPESLAMPLADLGRRHQGYGVLALDYDCVGKALLQALALRLGDGFDDDARASWGRLYAHVACTMLRAGGAAANE